MKKLCLILIMILFSGCYYNGYPYGDYSTDREVRGVRRAIEEQNSIIQANNTNMDIARHKAEWNERFKATDFEYKPYE